MINVKLFLPGRFEDAYVYMGRVVALTEDKTLRIYNLEEIVRFIEESDPGLLPVPTLMFARNEWLAGPQLRKAMQNEGVAREVLSAFRRFPQPYIQLEEPRLRADEYDIGFRADLILDLNVYNRRMYLASNTGLYHQDLYWDGESNEMSGAAVRKLDARCLGTSVGFGAVNASCADEGLFAAVDDFGWSERRESLPAGDHLAGMTKVSDRSIRTAWSGFNLVNYADLVSPALLRTSHERVEPNFERERSLITEVDTEPVDLHYILDSLSRKFDIPPKTFQYAYNHSNNFYVHTVDGSFYEAKVSSPAGGQPKVTHSKAHSGAESRVLSANPTRVGQVIETFDRLLIFANDEWNALVDSEVISVRTFPRSIRYKNLVAITTEDGILIAGLFDDSPYTSADGGRSSFA